MQLSGAFTVEINAEHLAQAVAERVVEILREEPERMLERDDHDVERHRPDVGESGVLLAVLAFVGSVAATVPLWIGAVL